MLYLVTVTAASPSAQSALEELGRRGELALRLLESQLGDLRVEEGLPGPAAMVIAQSPVLMSGQEAVLELRGTEETDDSGQQPSPSDSQPLPPASPIPEEPAQPPAPLIFADNGVAAHSLLS